MNDDFLINATLNCLDKLVSTFNILYQTDIDYPVVSLDLKGVVGGQAHYNEWTIKLNRQLFKENFDEYINQVIPHEFAHLATNHYYGTYDSIRRRRVQPHGKEWKSIMSRLGYKPDRCHNMDVTNTRRKNKTVMYVCPKCNTLLEMGIIRHNRMVQGIRNYTHASCGVRVQQFGK